MKNVPSDSRQTRRYSSSGVPLNATLDQTMGVVTSISAGGIGCKVASDRPLVLPGTRLPQVLLSRADVAGAEWELGPARVVRVEASEPSRSGEYFLGLAFETDQTATLDGLLAELPPEQTGSAMLRHASLPAGPRATTQTLDQFADQPDGDLFAKCRTFRRWIDGMHAEELYQRFYRLQVLGPIDRRITVLDHRGKERSLVCFDSNSYLGLHLHPRVIEEVERVTRLVGYGTPSAQLLCGTNRYLIELEERLAAFHGRRAAMVFPSGFSANTGILRALLRSGDAVFRDQHAHASIHEGCRKSGAERSKVFAHNDVAYLDRLLTQSTRMGVNGKLVVTDGVFSMHGELAPLVDLSAVCRKHGARLMVDDAHGVGVVGRSGRGIEEHFDCPGAVDILMGTLSKTLGALGGYVVGSDDLIDYLRWFAPSGLFTTALPAPLCAGVIKALSIIETEPEHQARLWENIRRFVPPLEQAGFQISGMHSPIVTVFVGPQETLWQVSRDLYDAGIKAGNVIYPAVPRDGCILRFTVNARHTDEDIDWTVEQLITVGRRYGLVS